MEQKLIDDAFYVEEKKYGLWQSHHPDGKGIITSLTEEECVKSTRFYLKLKQDEKNGLKIETKTYSGEVGGKL
jgi:hypothetical protein